jgi:hypothetical protein
MRFEEDASLHIHIPTLAMWVLIALDYIIAEKHSENPSEAEPFVSFESIFNQSILSGSKRARPVCLQLLRCFSSAGIICRDAASDSFTIPRIPRSRCSKLRFALPNSGKKESNAEPTPKNVGEDDKSMKLLRQRQAEAAIVRAMKSAKESKHHDLFHRVAEQLQPHFAITMPFFKSIVEDLIGKGYLRRAAPGFDIDYEFVA